MTNIESRRKMLFLRIFITFVFWIVPFSLYLSNQLKDYKLNTLSPLAYSENQTVPFLVTDYPQISGDVAYILYTQILNHPPKIDIVSDCLLLSTPFVQVDTISVEVNNVTRLPCPVTVNVAYQLDASEIFSYNVFIGIGMFPHGAKYRSASLVTKQVYNSDGTLQTQTTTQTLSVLLYDTVAVNIAAEHNTFQQWVPTAQFGNIVSFSFSIAGICWTASLFIMWIVYRCQGKRQVSGLYFMGQQIRYEI